jgi:hypothetical protein
MAHVAHEIVEPRKAALVAQDLHRLRHAAGSDGHCPCAAPGGAAVSPQVLRCELRMEPQFLLEVAILPTRTECPPEPDDPLAEYGHKVALVMSADSRLPR